MIFKVATRTTPFAMPVAFAPAPIRRVPDQSYSEGSPGRHRFEGELEASQCDDAGADDEHDPLDEKRLPAGRTEEAGGRALGGAIARMRARQI